MKHTRTDGVVLALGGGGARGLAHIGVMEILAEEGIAVRAVVGTSVGAEIGALYAAGVPLQTIRRLALNTDWLQTMRLFSPDFGEGGISSGKGIRKFLEPYLNQMRIEQLDTGFAAVAADIETGEEVVLSGGNLLDAVCASLSIPGLLSPTRHGDRLLVDGGLVNPVPFDVARKLFGGPVVGVAAHARVRTGQIEDETSPEWMQRLEELLDADWLNRWPQVRDWLKGFRQADSGDAILKNVGLSTVLNRSLLISEDTIMRLRQQLLPPDLMLAPAVDGIGLLEFYRARDAIQAGRAAARDIVPRIRHVLGEDRDFISE